MCLCVMLLIKVVLLENFLQRPHSALRCCFSCLSVVQGHGTVTMVNFFVLVCLGQHAQLFGQTQCYCGHEAFEDAPNTEPDDLVLCRWASTSPMKPCGGAGESFPRQQTFCLQRPLDCGTSCFQGQLAVFPVDLCLASSQYCRSQLRYLPVCPELCNNSLLLFIILY